MKTIRIKVYEFKELSESAKQVAINRHRERMENQFYFDEVIDSCKAMADLFNLKFGREYTDLRWGHIEDKHLELSGVGLYKYLVNNYRDRLFKPAYIKMIDRAVYWPQFVCKRGKGVKGEYTQIFSKTRVNDECVLTGMCYDNNILKPIYDFLARPDKNTTLEDLFSSIESAIQKTFQDVENWVNSDEFISEEIEANKYEFTQDGKFFNY